MCLLESIIFKFKKPCLYNIFIGIISGKIGYLLSSVSNAIQTSFQFQHLLDTFDCPPFAPPQHIHNPTENILHSDFSNHRPVSVPRLNYFVYNLVNVQNKSTVYIRPNCERPSQMLTVYTDRTSAR